jgi:DNA mismatch repair protein MutL
MPIRLLPPEVADAIAAGEVVERPASVVKELVENSIDAGATAISIEIRGSGRTLIRVADDGSGIQAPELPLAFARHATSKVSALTDLDSIGSLGFRGEALASIAAVADVHCESSGARVRFRAGAPVEQGPAAPAPGTRVEVRDLFANTPARLRFLKSDATESAAAARAAAQYALSHPEIAFTVTVDGRTRLRTPGDGGLLRAVAAVHGSPVGGEMIEVDWADTEAEIAVSGAVSQPRLSRGTRDGILLSVNRRPIASQRLMYALEACYQGSLERGRHPLAVLDVRTPPGTVDVNVHPAKREVRFRQEGQVFAAVQRAVREALGQSSPYRLPIPTASAAGTAGVQIQSTIAEVREARAPAYLASPEPEHTSGGVLRPLGQIMNGYLVAEGPDGLVLVDQHAAHERILYNRFRALMQTGGPSQRLLIPQVLEVGPGEIAALADHQEELGRLGFEIEEFGPRAIRLLAAPVDSGSRGAVAVVEMLGLLAEGRRDTALDAALISLACHSAVRFGDRLDPAEQRRLLEDLEAASDDITCPHGRPTRLLLDWQQLKRHFRRNY